MSATLSKAQAEFLQSIDTPTVCNLLEIVAPERRGFGYTVRHLHCPFPNLPPMVGFAKTVTMRAQDRVPLGCDDLQQVADGRRVDRAEEFELARRHRGHWTFPAFFTRR